MNNYLYKLLINDIFQKYRTYKIKVGINTKKIGSTPWCNG